MQVDLNGLDEAWSKVDPKNLSRDDLDRAITAYLSALPSSSPTEVEAAARAIYAEAPSTESRTLPTIESTTGVRGTVDVLVTHTWNDAPQARQAECRRQARAALLVVDRARAKETTNAA